MEGQKRRTSILERISQFSDIPADILTDLPRLELIGDGELRVEQHKGILAYGQEEIHVSGGNFIIKIRGEQLNLRAMTGMELLITGRIESIQLV